jgi:cytoskeletal protein CcmA (bactofilin family)
MQLFKPRSHRPRIEIGKLSSLIAEDVVITGDVHFSGGLRIDGIVKGSVVALPQQGPGHALLVLSAKGQVHGSVRCGDAVLNGTVVGDIEVEHFLELQSESRVNGSIRYHHLQMDVGAAVHGQLIAAQSAAQPAPAADNVVALACEKTSHAERR